VRGHQRRQRFGDAPQQHRVGLEQVLVEVLVRHHAGPELELTGQVRAVEDVASEVGVVAHALKPAIRPGYGRSAG
jgi:hypothetical protein